MKRLLIVSILTLVLSISAMGPATAAVYNVNATSTGGWTVTGTLEFDGANYVNWNLVSTPAGYAAYNYTPGNSNLTNFSPFFTSTNLGPSNFAVESDFPVPDGGFLWLRFDTPLTGAGTTAGIVPGGITNGSADSRRDLSANTWFYNSLQGTAEEPIPIEPTTWGRIKRLFE